MRGKIGMQAFAIAIGLMLAVLVPAMAQKAPTGDPARLAAAKELMAAQGGIEQANKALEQISNAMVAEVRRSSPAEADGLQRFMKSYASPTNPTVKAFFENVLKSSIDFYADRCTVEEMKAMTAFMGSPAGKKFLSIAPDAATVLAPHMVQFQKALIADVQAAAQRGEFKK